MLARKIFTEKYVPSVDADGFSSVGKKGKVVKIKQTIRYIDDVKYVWTPDCLTITQKDGSSQVISKKSCPNELSTLNFCECRYDIEHRLSYYHYIAKRKVLVPIDKAECRYGKTECWKLDDKEHTDHFFHN